MEVAAVVAVPSVLLYVLGVLAFWLRITREYEGVSPGTTWYAASLVPRSTAAASGIEVIARGFVLGALASAAVLLAVYVIAYARSEGEGPGQPGNRASVTPLLLPASFLLAGAVVWVLVRLLTSGGSGYGLPFYLGVAAVGVLLLALVVAGPLIVEAENVGGSAPSPFGYYSNFVYGAIGAVLVISVFGSMLFPREPSLSCLWKEDPKGEMVEANVVGTQSEREPRGWTLEGGFLSKDGGTWYVLTAAERIQAIPDDEFMRVVGGTFSVRYQRIGGDGRPAGEPVPEESRSLGQPYAAVEYCSGFPSQPTVIDYGRFTVSQTSTWVRESTEGE